jgi:hypothetical protein
MAVTFFLLEAKCHSGIPTIFKDITKNACSCLKYFLLPFGVMAAN